MIRDSAIISLTQNRCCLLRFLRRRRRNNANSSVCLRFIFNKQCSCSPYHQCLATATENGFHRSVVTARQNTVPSVPSVSSVPSFTSVPYVLGNGRFLRNGRNGRYVRMETRHQSTQQLIHMPNAWLSNKVTPARLHCSTNSSI